MSPSDAIRQQRWFVPVCVVLISLLVSFVLAELTCRVVIYGSNAFSYSQMRSLHPLGTAGVLRPSSVPELLFEFKPGLNTVFKMVPLRTNSVGLRDQEYSLEKPSGVIRIAVIGDSFSMPSGVAIEDAYHSLLEQKMSAHFGFPVEFINFSVGGYSLRQYAALLREKVAPYSPDFIILGFCAANDFKVTTVSRYRKPYRVLPVSDAFFDSHLWLLFDRVFLRREKTRIDDEGLNAEQARHLRNRFRDIAEAAQSMNVPLQVVYLDVAQSNSDPIKQLSDEYGFSFVDASAPFAGKEPDQFVLHRLDGHPNAEAHKLFAQAIEPVIEEKIERARSTGL